MKKLIYIFIALAAFACSNKEKKAADGGWDITLSGKVNYPQQGPLVLEELTMDNNGKIDSIEVGSDGTFSKAVHLTDAGYYRLNCYNLQVVDFILDRADVVITVDGNDASGAFDIKGSPDYDLIRDVQLQMQAFQRSPEVQQIESEGQAASQANNEARIKELQDKYLALRYTAIDNIVKSLESKPVNLGLINLLQGNMFALVKDRYFPFYKQVADKAIAQSPNNIHIKQFADMVSKMAVIAIGQKAPEISLADPDGKTVSLSSLKGKYVLVDFWASWCKPCRAENPNVVKAYKQFKDKGFEVFGVSLDRSKEDWLEAIKQDGLTWTHVSDLKYFESQAALDYNVNGIPFQILVDPDGVIIANADLRGNALRKKLEEVLNKKI